ncbi:hypothetical protein AB6A40_002857 [Gnathostoma spinigerum]|uniref:Uncharacterized protein n=1 Tax=Gnathostoma spinigerum TaxID=75299 RepID=A0ABD6E7T6_9BILA
MNMRSASELEEFEKVQAERREYVKNIGIEYRFGCYEEKRADSCHLLGEYMEAIERNFKSALSLFSLNCEQRKYAPSCFKYSMYLLAGKECEPSLSKTIPHLEISCESNIPVACRYLGLVYWNGEPTRLADPKKAEACMKKACDLEDAKACWMLSTWYLGPTAKFKRKDEELETKYTHLMGSLERDMAASLEYGIRACELNVPESCANVGRMYKIGDGMEKNVEKAKEYYDKAKDIIKNLKERDVKPDFTGI